MTLLLSVATLRALAVVSPGPNVLMTARSRSLVHAAPAVRPASGIALGAVCWRAAGCLGGMTLFIAAPWMYLTIKAVGAA
jgi:threonine/homoserine/homoserine lactone efflux protein